MSDMKLCQRIITTDNSKVTILMRLSVGGIFLSEGIQKFLFPDTVGEGRFEDIGFNNPGFWAQFTGTFEILCGCLILLGLFIRFAAIPLLIIMFVAFITTKYPILVSKGFWSMAHEYRTDFAMTIGIIILMIKGAGNWSFDRKLMNI